MCGVTTNIVTSVEITGPEVHDCPMFPALVDATADRFEMREVSADKAYLSRRNVALVAAHGATPYIPFKTDSTGATPGASELWKRLFHL